MIGCGNNAKNKLTTNYLHLAEKNGAEIHELHEVYELTPLDGGGFEVLARHPGWAQRAVHAPALIRRAPDVHGFASSLELLEEIQVVHRVAQSPVRLAFPEATDERVLRSMRLLIEDKIARPVLLGDAAAIQARAAELGVDLDGVEIQPLIGRADLDRDVATLLQLRGRQGLTATMAHRRMTTDGTSPGWSCCASAVLARSPASSTATRNHLAGAAAGRAAAGRARRGRGPRHGDQAGRCSSPTPR
jgi:hypothetical protein